MTPHAIAVRRRGDGSIDTEFYSRRAFALRNGEIRSCTAGLWRWLAVSSGLTMPSADRSAAGHPTHLPSRPSGR